MKKIVILGSGLVGNAIAKELCKEYKVYAADNNIKILESIVSNDTISPIHTDLSETKNIKKIVKQADLVINALPGFMGTAALKTVIKQGIDIVDIAFSPEDAFELDDLAKKNKVTAVVDCGLAPGLCNMILGYQNKRMKTITSYECLVGGLPVEREWPYEYKAVFSPIDVIEEYTRPSRYIENGVEVVKPALSDPDFVYFKGIGTLESFNTDGLRTLLKTMNIVNMKEKTLRYPGHIHLMKVLRETGFFDKDPISYKGIELSPIEFTSKILFPNWKMKENEADFTVMRVIIEGIENGKKKKIIYDLYDQFDWNTKTSSMARTTGYTCTSVARLIVEGKFKYQGICAPEHIGEKHKIFYEIFDYLEGKGIKFKISEE